jgi:5'-nucleotidase
MNILVSNDDGIYAEGLWALVRELAGIARVTVVAPDREQSARGTAITLRQPFRVQPVVSPVDGVSAYAVAGTPADSVIVALGRLINEKVDLVISGINRGPNLGDDVLVSGTVGAALQGYLRGLPAIAISLVVRLDTDEHLHLDTAAKTAALLAARIYCSGWGAGSLLNVNVPNLPPQSIKGVVLTQLAHKTHIETVEEDQDNKQSCFWLERRNVYQDSERRTDIRAVAQGNIAVTRLDIALSGKRTNPISTGFCRDIFRELVAE